MGKSHYKKSVLSFSGLLLASVVFIQSCGVEKPAEVVLAEKQLPEAIDYNLHVKPILSENCFFCHGPDENTQEAGLELATREGALAALKEDKDKYAIVPGNLAKSEVFHRIITTDEEQMMPPKSSHRELSAYDKAVLIKWIEQGAEYKPHWAFIEPEKHQVPAVKDTTWPENPIDNFVLSKLEEKGMKPSPEADKETLLRRVTLDLTGLPPTVAEVDAYVADQSPNAYEKVVNRLLESPHYGEKMAVNWLDLARFADTHGYSQDQARPVWPWRDWVIKSYNENMPFDQFTTWQLAGDLLPNPTREQRLATGFNRNHAQNGEGGIVNEEYRVEYVLDRTNTLGTAFLGLTAECSRCHDHKFDPISQKDYFKMSAFFNQVDEAGQITLSDDLPVPTMLLTTAKHDSLLAFIDNKIEKTESALANTIRMEQADFEKWRLAKAETLPFDKKKGLQAHFTFDKLVGGKFASQVSAKHKGTVVDPVLVPGKLGKAFHTNGDDILRLEKVGIFNRANPFSIGCWVKIPEDDIAEGVIFHKGNGDITYNFRGYYLNLREGKIELLMAHTWPFNNIVKVTPEELPKEQWLHLTMTYDGSSKADGLKLYIDGKEANLITEKDNLYKDILFGGRTAFGDEPSLQVGADVRGTGFKNGQVDDLYVYERVLTAPEVLQLAQEPGSNADKQPSFDANTLSHYYFANLSSAYQQHLDELEKLRQQKNKIIEEVPEAMVMDDMEKKRPTYVLIRGLYDSHGEEVQPGTPGSVLSFPKDLPQNRLGLAKWLFNPDNPLTARVAVNRYWQTYFGKGLQKTANDFGNQGSLPSHPKLLDWLAVTFRELDWDVKAMQKLIVMSATYRQSSIATPEQLKKDLDNTFLARGPSFRLTAEMVRDNALAASGLLTPKIGGPSVKPYQPEGLWAMNNAVYVADTGAALYRRSLYTFWKRTNPPPSMDTFDAPTRSSCIVKRQQTNTPLQTLVLLNDPQFVEAAKVVAEKAAKKYPLLKDRLIYTYRMLTTRMPQENELAILTRLYGSEYEKFKQHPAKMKGWLNIGEYNLTQELDQTALAAGAVVASTVMNSDAFITRR